MRQENKPGPKPNTDKTKKTDNQQQQTDLDTTQEGIEDEPEGATATQSSTDTAAITVDTGITGTTNTDGAEQPMDTDSDNFNLAEVGRQAKSLQDKANYRIQAEADQWCHNNLEESETDRELEQHLQNMRQQSGSSGTATETFQQIEERVQEAAANRPTPEPPSLNFDIAQASTDQAMPNDPKLKRVVTGKYNKQKCPILTNTGSNLSQLDPGSGLNTQTESNSNPELRRSKKIPVAKRTARYGA